MGMFSEATTDGLQETEDRLGGGFILDSSIYDAKIKVMYGIKSDGGAKGVVAIFDIKGKEYRETIYVTSKEGKNYWVDKNRPNDKNPLPGFTTINDICLVTDGKPLNEQPTEEKTVNVWDSEARKELPKSVPVLVDLIGKEVTLGILKVLENKNEKVNGDYVPTNDTRESNSIDKVFHTESRKTVAEARQGRDTAEFYGKWLEKNEGNTSDKRKNKTGGDGAKSGPPQGGQGSQRKSLFS